MTIRIGRHKIGPGYPAFIIAEAGVNHNGSLKMAKQLIDLAISAGADAVKFQNFRAEELATRNAPKAKYQNLTAPGETQFEMLKRLELSESATKELYSYCKKKGILFLSTPFDALSAKLLKNVGVPAFKISSGELTNTPLLYQIAGYGKPIILSTGMANIDEVATAVKTIYRSGNRKLVLLHCTSNYPTRYEDCNLRAMETMRRRFRVPIGYSDHTLGTIVATAAVALGANVIEKHFTLDVDLPGPDHKASLSPESLRELISSIKNTENALGNGRKIPVAAEIEVRNMARKSIVSRKNLSAGTILTKDMLGLKRPGTGIPPSCLKDIIGRKLNRNVSEDALLSWKWLS